MAKGVDNKIHTDKAGQPIYWNAIAMIVSRFDIHTLYDPIYPLPADEFSSVRRGKQRFCFRFNLKF